ncbi:unnamed protein product [Nezara viridula]|uniref:Uncharacterized protein n=1 Tax=Nezara viridula TaxID=85310 RepID=A0A9P0E2A5_NEZVI|nr:unnamed protein product [Nezara viridula]
MISMNDPTVGMLPFDGIGLYEQPKTRFIFKMPRVVPDQKAKFESDELFRRLSRESELFYYKSKRNGGSLPLPPASFLNLVTPILLRI